MGTWLRPGSSYRPKPFIMFPSLRGITTLDGYILLDPEDHAS